MKVKWGKSLSCVQLCNPYTVHGILQARILEWDLLQYSPGDLPSPGIEPRSPALQADSLPAEPQGKKVREGWGGWPTTFGLSSFLDFKTGNKELWSHITNRAKGMQLRQRGLWACTTGKADLCSWDLKDDRVATMAKQEGPEHTRSTTTQLLQTAAFYERDVKTDRRDFPQIKTEGTTRRWAGEAETQSGPTPWVGDPQRGG